MKLFWIEFKKGSTGMLFRLGCGISAVDKEDAWKVVRESKTLSTMMENVSSIKEIKASEIEKNHVLPNSGNYASRGIWFPNGI
ncbi:MULTISPECIES: hypothetical protein [unclassified Rhizobium]|jgi:hypothetical protein|uniref:hypothetical protein n=1 Tax=Rhizobium sp. GCM10022189 TaxID=3252654 RepID=UPI003610BE32